MTLYQVGDSDFSPIELYRIKESIGEVEFQKLFHKKIMSGDWDLLSNKTLRLKDYESAMGYNMFSFLIGIQAEYRLKMAYENGPVPMKAVFKRVDSSAETEEWDALPPALFPKRMQPGNPAHTFQAQNTKGTQTNYQWGIRVQIEEGIVRYDKKGQLVDRLTKLGESFRLWEEKKRTEALIDLSGATYLGSALYANSADYGYNLYSGAASAYSTGSIKVMRKRMVDQKQPGDETMPAMMTAKFIIFPQDITDSVLRTTKSANYPDTADEGYNWLKDLNLEPIENQWLPIADSTAGTTAWYLAADQNRNGMIEQVVMDMRTTKIVGTDELKLDGLYLDMAIDTIKSWGANDFRGVIKAVGV